nr:zinc finger, CCHC-type [Tanacetum cinerariifolium]
MLHMKEDETIDTFTTKLSTLVNKAASLGHTMKDEELVHKLLNAVRDRYLQIVASIEQYSDLEEMTLEEAIGRLKTYEERIKRLRANIAHGDHKWKEMTRQEITESVKIAESAEAAEKAEDSREVCHNVNALASRLLGAYDLEIAILRAVVHDDDKTSRDARSWYMISGDAKSWVCDCSHIFTVI